MQRIGNVKKTTIQISPTQNAWAKAQAKKMRMQGGLGAYIRYLLDQDIKASLKYR